MPADEGTSTYYAHYCQTKIPDWVKIMFWVVVIGGIILIG